MLRQVSHEFTIRTRGRGLYEFTDEIAAWVAKSASGNGLVTLHVRHTSASLLIQENADPDVRRDLETFFSRLVRDGDTTERHAGDTKVVRKRTHQFAIIGIPEVALVDKAPGRDSFAVRTDRKTLHRRLQFDLAKNRCCLHFMWNLRAGRSV